MRTYIDYLNGVKSLPHEWWRVNSIIENCIKEKNFAVAYDILMMWRKTNIVSAATYDALISICRAALEEVDHIGDMKNPKAKELIKLLEAEDFQYILKDGQRAINLAQGSKMIHVSGLLDYIKSKYKKLIDSIDDDNITAGKDYRDGELIVTKSAIEDSFTTRNDNGKLKEKKSEQKQSIVSKKYQQTENSDYFNWDEIEFKEK